jgi:replicative DNA helicase
MNAPEPKAPRVALLSDLVSDFVADAEAAAKAKKTGMARGPQTGVPSLDEALGSYLAPGVHTLQAAPGAGKTAFALQTAARCGFPALFVSAEMPILELFRRLIARETGTFLGKLKSGEIEPKAAMQLAVRAAEKVPNIALMDATSAFASPTTIRDAAVALKDRTAAEHVLVVIDSLQIWARSGKLNGGDSATEYDAINNALSAAASIAGGLNCPLLLVSHRNRAGNKSDGGLHAAKGSGDIEYVSESIIDLTRKDEQPDAAGEVEVKAVIHKNRHGVAGVSFPLRFVGRLQEFREGR